MYIKENVMKIYNVTLKFDENYFKYDKISFDFPMNCLKAIIYTHYFYHFFNRASIIY